MIRREFLKNAAVLASGLAAKISYGAPCPPPLDGAPDVVCNQSGQSNLERRTGELTSSNTPQLGVNYFMSNDGSPSVANNNTPNQNSNFTYGTIGIYYDPIRRHMHQLDKQHSGSHLEHAIYDEVANTWSQVTDLGPYEGVSPSHWRAQGFDPTSGILYYMQEAKNELQWFDPYTNAWQITSAAPANLVAENDGSTPYVGGFHPNLFGYAKPGFLVLTYRRAMAWNILEETWHQLNSTLFPSGTALYALSHGEGWYIPETDELLLTGRGIAGNIHGSNFCIAIDAGAGNLTTLSEGNGATVRNKPPKPIAGLNTGKMYACMHPRQPNVVLAFDAANPAVCWYTDDAGVTPWTQAPFTTPFAAELNSAEQMTVGSLPYHGVVAGSDTFGSGISGFCFWRPPLV